MGNGKKRENMLMKWFLFLFLFCFFLKILVSY